MRSFVELAAPFVEVDCVLVRAPARWIPDLVRDAQEWGTSLMARVGFGSGMAGMHLDVHIDIGRPVRSPGRTIIPMRWQATRASALFPVMEADLEVAALGPDLTQLSVDGRYDPPMGRAGRIADRALMHRVAEATVHDFVERVGRQLMQAIDEAGVRLGSS